MCLINYDSICEKQINLNIKSHKSGEMPENFASFLRKQHQQQKHTNLCSEFQISSFSLLLLLHLSISFAFLLFISCNRVGGRVDEILLHNILISSSFVLCFTSSDCVAFYAFDLI